MLHGANSGAEVVVGGFQVLRDKADALLYRRRPESVLARWNRVEGEQQPSAIRLPEREECSRDSIGLPCAGTRGLLRVEGEREQEESRQDRASHGKFAKGEATIGRLPYPLSD